MLAASGAAERTSQPSQLKMAIQKTTAALITISALLISARSLGLRGSWAFVCQKWYHSRNTSVTDILATGRWRDGGYGGCGKMMVAGGLVSVAVSWVS